MNVLNYEMHISRANDFLGPKPPIMAGEAKHIGAIDSALLRTCRAIYHETIVILYAMNWFDLTGWVIFNISRTMVWKTSRSDSSVLPIDPYPLTTVLPTAGSP